MVGWSEHIPVLLEEGIEALRPQRGGRYVDCTVGGGGHAQAILEASAPGGQLLGIDADPEAIKTAQQRLAPYAGAVLLVNENFERLEHICSRHNFRPVQGILFDLGMSWLQIEDAARGFSFQHSGPLNMRFSPRQTLTAADIVNTYPESELADLLARYGEEPHSRQIARHIVANRPVHSSGQLARLVERVAGGTRRRIHPATRTFQALRIAVNRELEHLESALAQAVNLLGFEGRLVVISYHSLEDRLVKQFLRQEAQGCLCPPRTPVCCCGHRPSLKLIAKKVIRPSPQEVAANPRSRSAKMRVAERIQA
jgi:16S rRNA (cytosine1402-N4)-methyltransferase